MSVRPGYRRRGPPRERGPAERLALQAAFGELRDILGSASATPRMDIWSAPRALRIRFGDTSDGFIGGSADSFFQHNTSVCVAPFRPPRTRPASAMLALRGWTNATLTGNEHSNRLLSPTEGHPNSRSYCMLHADFIALLCCHMSCRNCLYVLDLDSLAKLHPDCFLTMTLIPSDHRLVAAT